MSMKTRLKRLEQNAGGDAIVIAHVPLGWPADNQETSLDGLAAEAGAVQPFSYLVIEDKTRTEPAVRFVGPAVDFFQGVSRRSMRIGVTRA